MAFVINKRYVSGWACGGMVEAGDEWPESRPLLWQALAALDWNLRVSRFWGNTADLILVYHSVGGASAYPFDLRADRFETHVRNLTERYRVVDIERIITEPNAAEKRVVLTFDDGFENVYTEALPVLRRYEVPATVLVCPDLIENADRDLLRRRHGLSEASPLGVLTPKQLQELAASEFVTVGSHTATHPNLTELSAEEVHAEVVGSRTQLKRLTGTDVTRFSYPYGAVTDEVTQVVEETYEISFTSQPDFLSANSVPHQLPRLDACLPIDVLSFEVTDMAYALRRVARRLNLG